MHFYCCKSEICTKQIFHSPFQIVVVFHFMVQLMLLDSNKKNKKNKKIMNPLLLSDEKLDECEQKKLQQLLDVIYLINDNDGRK